MPETPTAKKIDKCRLTGGDLLPVFDLGAPCVSDFLPPGTAGVPAPLCVAVAKEAPYLAQLTHSYPPEAMYRRYHYRSGTNEAMRAELSDVVAKARRLRPVKDDDFVLDIACNDGTLLKAWGNDPEIGVVTIGIDPSDVAREAWEREESLPNGEIYEFVNDFFSLAAYQSIAHKPASVVTCVAMFYDLDDPIAFLKDVRAVIADDGLFVLQVAYIPMHVRMGAWDYVGHEHLTAWDYKSLAHALKAAGFAVVDAEITSSNGGSVRVYATPEEDAARMRGTVEGMAGDQRRAILHASERCETGVVPAYGWQSVKDAWCDLAWKATMAKVNLLAFLRKAREEGRTVAGYAASTKANTLLQFCGVTPDLLPMIADRQPHKHGMVTVGTGIPIVPEEEVRALKPDYLLCLAWQFADAFREREKDLLAAGTKLVLPLPTLTVLD